MPIKSKQASDFSEINVSIGDIARQLGVHTRTLRIYENEGIIQTNRTKTNRRKYTKNDYELLKAVTYMTQYLGLNLCGVKLTLAFLNKFKMNISDYRFFLETIAEETNINQNENYIKNKLKGRKKENYR